MLTAHDEMSSASLRPTPTKTLRRCTFRGRLAASLNSRFLLRVRSLHRALSIAIEAARLLATLLIPSKQHCTDS